MALPMATGCLLGLQLLEVRVISLSVRKHVITCNLAIVILINPHSETYLGKHVRVLCSASLEGLDRNLKLKPFLELQAAVGGCQ